MKKILCVFMLLSGLHCFSQTPSWGNLEKYAAANKILGMPAKGEKRVVFMGNSITEGWKMMDSSFFASKPYICRGISGQSTPQMLMRFRPDVIELKPAVVVILAGANDIAENNGPISIEAIAGNIISMVELAKANKIKVVMCSVLPANKFPWRPALQPADKVIALNKLLAAYALKNNIAYVDYYTAMVDNEKGLPKKYAEDGIHPTLEGYKIMEPLVEAGIQKALKKK